MYQCDDCKQEFQDAPAKDLYTFQGENYGICSTCAKTQKDGLIRTAARLDKTGRYAWPGGYPLAFYPPDGWCSLCFDCARSDLENGDGPLHAEVEDSDQKYYGGVNCDGCGAEIVPACCPECGDELGAKPLLFADNVDASMLCQRCAAKMVNRHCRALADDGTEHASDLRGTHARRLPGIGIEIVATPHPLRAAAWDNGIPWYASAGTVYHYPPRY